MTKDNFPDIGRYITIINRLMKMYYDHSLSDYDIGWGQQFFVEYIYDHPGATARDMAQIIRVDKGTITKAVSRLYEIGYVKIVPGETDKRVKHLYLTERALPAAEKIKEIHSSFYSVLCLGMDCKASAKAEDYLKMMFENLDNAICREWRD